MQLQQSNLDFNDHIKVWAISIKLNEQSEEYAKARKFYGEAKYEFDIALAAALPNLRQKKSNIGIETAQIMILEGENEYIRDLYRDLIERENHYKGLEKIIDALKTQITLAMSLIKNTQQQGAM